MTNVKNISTGPRGIHTTDRGLVMLEAGESADLNLAKGEDNEEWFSFDASDAEADGDELPNNVMKLKSIAKAEGIDIGDAKSAADIKAAIELAREAKGGE